MLGIREPALYGTESYDALVRYIEREAAQMKLEIEVFQSNHEGALIDKIHEAYQRMDGIIINPAAYTHTSIAIMDALIAVGLPAAEVHLTDISNREDYRRISYAGRACRAHFIGMGFAGYRAAMQWFCNGVMNEETVAPVCSDEPPA